MGGRGGGTNGLAKGSNGISAVPPSSRKMVQSLKEIVSCPESEIYAMLVECDMDPDETVSRLLTQDTFHEVKSKREKKKETKDTPDIRLRGANNVSSRTSRAGSDRYAGRTGPSQSTNNESSNMHGRTGNKKENGSRSYPGSSSSTSGSIGHQQPSRCDSIAVENKVPSVSLSSGGASLSQVPSGYLPAWLGAMGQVTMADVVKMGRQHSKASAVTNSSHHNIDTYESFAGTHGAFKEEWPSIEKPTALSASNALKASPDTESCLASIGMDDQTKSQAEEVNLTKTQDVDFLGTEQIQAATIANRNVQEDSPINSSHLDDHTRRHMDSYQIHDDALEQEEEESGSPIAADMQELSIDNDDTGAVHEEERPGVIIPDHLQVHSSDCLHLSFGSFGPAIGSGLSGHTASGPSNDYLDDIDDANGDPPIEPADSRNADLYGDEQVRMPSNENVVSGISASPRKYDAAADAQADATKRETPEAIDGHQYPFSSSATGYTFDGTQHMNTAFASAREVPQMPNFTSFANEMQGYSKPLPSTLLSSTVQSGREPDLRYSPFPVTQSIANDTASALTGPTISMAEALRAGGMSTSQPTQQTLPGANVASGPGLPQHVTMHPYSQPTLPLGHYASLIGYPFLAQNYPYMPSAFQQAFAGNSTYHQSLAAMLPQYKNSISVSSLSQSAGPGYGFGSTSHIPGGNFPLNPLSAGQNTTIGYDDVLSSQYKDNNPLMSLQQNENSPVWVQGPGSRSAVPASTYFNLLGQNQQPPGFLQAQQPSQHFGALGYPNMYSQTGLSLEQQHQNPRDAALGGSQIQVPKPNQPLWQNGY